MNTLKLISSGQHNLKNIVETALQNEEKRMEAGIRKTRKRLDVFESKYQQSTADFINDYENDRLEETMDFMEWVGEFRMMNRLLEKRAGWVSEA
ncbi:MAG: hypothetical protein V2I97_20415 [Desulfococcaceae bacterium]|jgi:hypothetical protein|nr:hypothetical protein [Desulfococcaceae bacterium]